MSYVYFEYNFPIIGKKAIFTQNNNDGLTLGLGDFEKQKWAEGAICKETPVHRETAKQVREYLAGERKQFELNIDVKKMPGTDFQRAVWQQMLAIPYGETRSYKWIADKIGRPAASRAVANACGQNPLAIVIPCHRVVRSNGELGGFSMSGGVEIKKKLLELEQSFSQSSRHPQSEKPE